MKVAFRQGLISYQLSGENPGFLQKTTGDGFNIDLRTDNRNTILMFADGSSDYLLVENNNISEAWGPFTPGPDYYLYWDINVKTGLRSFGHTVFPPVYGTAAPSSPSTSQHWFDTNNTRMMAWNGSSWQRVIRVFAGLYQGGTVLVPNLTGSQVGINTSTAAGEILYDDSGDPIFRGNKEFVTSELAFFKQNTNVSPILLESNIITVEAAENMSAYSVVTLSGFDTISLAQYEDTSSGVIAMVTESLSNGDVGTIIIQGLVENLNWNWSSVNAKLYVDTNGELTTTDPYTVSPGRGKHPPIGFVLSSTKILLMQGLGEIGPRGLPGPVTGVVDASTTTKGVVTLSLPPTSPSSPIVVGNNDPRLSDDRVPVFHTHPLGDAEVNTLSIQSSSGQIIFDADNINGFTTILQDSATAARVITLPNTSGTLIEAGGAHHNNFSDYIPNEHINHSTVSILPGAHMTGGGNITSSRTLGVFVSGQFNVNNNKIINLAQGTSDSDAVTLSQLNSVASGIIWKSSCRAATNVNLAANASIDSGTSYNNTGGTSGRGRITAVLASSNIFIIDGVTLSVDDRILVKDETGYLGGDVNGVYTVSFVGTALTLDRAEDFDQDAEVQSGAAIWVTEGDSNSSSGWTLTTPNPITIGGEDGTSITFSQFSGLGQIDAGLGITKTGDTLDLDVSDLSAITVPANADQFAIYDDGVGQRKITFQNLQANIDHNLLTNYVSNQHINWTSTSSNFNTSGSLTTTGEFTSRGIDDNADALAMTIDVNERVLINHTTAITPKHNGTTFTPPLQVTSTGANSGISINRYSANADSGLLTFVKSRNATAGSHTIVASGDVLGSIVFTGSSGGGSAYETAAIIRAAVDATPGTGNDMPGRLEFHTTPDGSATAIERVRIQQAGHVNIVNNLKIGGSAGDTPSAPLQVIGNVAVGSGNITVTTGNVIPGTDNTGEVGTTANTWSNGQFTNFTVDSTLDVRGAIDLADSNVIRFGNSDDAYFVYNPGNTFELQLETDCTSFIVTDNGSTKFTFSRTTGNLTATGTVSGATLASTGGITAGSDIVVTGGNILPGVDNTGVVGNSANTWSNGQFTNLTVDSTMTVTNTLNVRVAIDLADGDVVRFGSSDDAYFVYNAGNTFELQLEADCTDFIITDNGTVRFTFNKSTGDFSTSGNISGRLKAYTETVNAVGSTTAGTNNIDLSLANVHTVTLTGNHTLTLINPPATGQLYSATIIITVSGGAFTPTWAGGTFHYPFRAVPPYSATNGAVDWVTVMTVNGGTTYTVSLGLPDVGAP